MNDRKLIRNATEACARQHAANRAERRTLASKARTIIASDAAMARAVDKSDADLSRAEAVALLAMIRMKRMIESGQTVRKRIAPIDHAAVPAEAVAQ
jgi:hypothetical protein